MSEMTVPHLVAGWRIPRLPEWRDSPAGISVNDCIGELAKESAQAHFLQLKTDVAEAGAGIDADLAESMKAEAAVASMDFGDAVSEQLAKCLGSTVSEARWDAARIFWCRLAELARSASAGGHA